jgi:diguanylate cyclase (GGDEF)-like protein
MTQEPRLRLASYVLLVRRLAILYRPNIQDLSFVFACVLVAGFLLFETNVFMHEGTANPAEKALDLNEVLVLGALLTVGLLGFTWRLLSAQKKETHMRSLAEQHARELASQDALTGLANRRRFNDALSAALAAPPRADGTHALLMLDLNGFKKVNDVYGHGTGDQALIIVAQRLAAVARQGDLVARLGGDEFAILSQHLAGPEAATGIALRVIEALDSPLAIGSVQHHIGAAIGICLIPFDGESGEEAVRRADVALYKAKADGKPSLRFFEPEMDRHVLERELMERELRAAVANEDIHPFFQPLIDLSTKEVIGFEALARWKHATLGDIPPDRFIPLAEDSGLIAGLTDQLLRASCLAAAQWPANITLAFNVSPIQLKDRTFGLRVLRILAETGLSPHRLEVEITESALVRDLEAVREVLGSLQEAGIRVALDDFGTGYSSLYHLRNYKVDKIKIDRSFIETLGSERESNEIVSALIGLGHGLGLTITAEGIEEDSQLADLLSKGCGQGQGYLFSKAVSAEAAMGLLALAKKTAESESPSKPADSRVLA